jgi:hypothetical protein
MLVAQSVSRQAKAERPGFDSQQWQEIYLLSIASALALESTQPPIQLGTVGSFPLV